MNNVLKRNFPKMLFLFSFIILNLYIGLNYINKLNYTDNFIRLHVVANSNSSADQIDKFKVSQKVNDFIDSLNISKTTSKVDLINILKNNSNEILNIANSTSNYTPTLKIGKIKYEEKQSITTDMPSGTYDSVQIILGNGEGKNIWSLIFPNEKNIENIKKYESILPGINNLYKTECENITTEQTENSYEIKILEIIKNFI